MKHSTIAIDYEARIAALEASNAVLEVAVLDLLGMHKAMQRANEVFMRAAFLEAQETDAAETARERAR